MRVGNHMYRGLGPPNRSGTTRKWGTPSGASRRPEMCIRAQLVVAWSFNRLNEHSNYKYVLQLHVSLGPRLELLSRRSAVRSFYSQATRRQSLCLMARDSKFVPLSITSYLIISGIIVDHVNSFVCRYEIQGARTRISRGCFTNRRTMTSNFWRRSTM